MPVSLKDQAVLVVGASSGIGRDTAVLFAREGARVMAAARRRERLAELQKQLAAEGHPIEICAADASVPSQMEDLGKQTLAKFGKVDIMVYVTGTNTPNRYLDKLTPKLWDELISVNLNGAFYATHAVLPSMRQNGGGHLIYISSVSGLFPDVSGSAYQASKRGLIRTGTLAED